MNRTGWWAQYVLDELRPSSGTYLYYDQARELALSIRTDQAEADRWRKLADELAVALQEAETVTEVRELLARYHEAAKEEQ